MIRIKNAVYPIVAAAALVLMAWQPMDVSPVRHAGATLERSVSNDTGEWLLPVPVAAPSASSKI